MIENNLDICNLDNWLFEVFGGKLFVVISELIIE